MTNNDLPVYLKEQQVLKLLQITHNTLYCWIKEAGFPSNYKIGKNSKRWKTSEVMAWVERQKGK